MHKEFRKIYGLIDKKHKARHLGKMQRRRGFQRNSASNPL